jgi:type IV secretory pathway VirB6-like protein
MKTIDKIKSLLEKLPHILQVSFALHCAEDVYPLTKDNKKAKLCIDLVKEWLRNPDRPGLEEELVAAAYATASATNAAAHSAANAAAYAAYATTIFAAHDAANAAAYAAYATTIFAAHDAAYAARAAANAAAAYDEKIKEYYEVLLGYLTEVEKELLDLEFVSKSV